MLCNYLEIYTTMLYICIVNISITNVIKKSTLQNTLFII